MVRLHLVLLLLLLLSLGFFFCCCYGWTMNPPWSFIIWRIIYCWTQFLYFKNGKWRLSKKRIELKFIYLFVKLRTAAISTYPFHFHLITWLVAQLEKCRMHILSASDVFLCCCFYLPFFHPLEEIYFNLHIYKKIIESFVNASRPNNKPANDHIVHSRLSLYAPTENQNFVHIYLFE